MDAITALNSAIATASAKENTLIAANAAQSTANDKFTAAKGDKDAADAAQASAKSDFNTALDALSQAALAAKLS